MSELLEISRKTDEAVANEARPAVPSAKNPVSAPVKGPSASPVQRPVAAPVAKPASVNVQEGSVHKTVPQKDRVPAKKSPVKRFFRNAGIVVSCLFEELFSALSKGFKSAKNSSLSLKMTVAAVLFTCICSGLVVGLTMLVHGEANEVENADCVIGAKKHIVTEEQKAAYAEDKASGVVTDSMDPERFVVTFDFYSKEDVSCATGERTVGELMELLGLSLEETDILTVEKDSVISEDSVIAVDELSYGTDCVYSDISYDTEYVDVQTIPRGTEKTHRRGTLGKMATEYTVTYVNGVETERVAEREYTSTYPVSAVVYRGVGGIVNIGGQNVSYSYYIDCDSTYYYSGGTTASGLPADENVVAVDPRVIPLGTKIFIPGIGSRTAADTGGAIKGNIIDICFDRDNPLCKTYGRRTVRVYILG